MNYDDLRRRLFQPVDIAGLVFFRIALGAIMLVEVGRYFQLGFIRRYWIEAPLNFTWYGFDWVQRLPPAGMYLLFALLGILALMIMLGCAYRISMILFTVGLSYVFLLEQGRYLNHFYLLCLLSMQMCFIPAHRAFSIDAWLRPSLRADSLPAWTLWLLRAQLAIVYFFGGVAKLNADWLCGEPMRIWMAERTDFPLLGPWFTEEWMVYLFSYSGLLLDLLIAPALLWKPTRKVAFALITLFHVMNSQLFPIGIFPWFMIAATTLFFPSSWPRTLLRRLRSEPKERAETEPPVPSDRLQPAPSDRWQRVIVGLLAVYLAVQVALPFRHFLYPGNASWSEEGHQFAWRMKLREKRGPIEFLLTDPRSGTTFKHDPADYLPAWQVRVLAFSPDLIHQYSLHLARQMRVRGYERMEVRVRSAQSLNGRRPQWLIDPTVDLAAQPRGWKPAPWVMPLETPLGSHVADNR